MGSRGVGMLEGDAGARASGLQRALQRGLVKQECCGMKKASDVRINLPPYTSLPSINCTGFDCPACPAAFCAFVGYMDRVMRTLHQVAVASSNW